MTILAVINTQTMVTKVFDNRSLVDQAQIEIYDDTTAQDVKDTLNWLFRYNSPGRRLARQAADITNEMNRKLEASKVFVEAEAASWKEHFAQYQLKPDFRPAAVFPPSNKIVVKLVPKE